MPLAIRWRWLLLTGVVCIAPLFFIGGPSQYSLEIYRRLWDLGHPAFFFCVCLLAIGFGLIKNSWHFLFGLLIVFLASLSIETLQTFVDREASWLDILLNLSGFISGGVFLSINRRAKIFLIAIAFLGLLPALLKLVKSAMVTWALWSQFPLLLAGNSVWERHAWGNEIKLQQLADQQSYLLSFNGKMYSSADLMGFIQSWRTYRSLVLEVENPASEIFSITLRISDKQHEMSAQVFSDRFNRQLAIHPGKQTIIIDMKDIETAPANRKMNLDEIYLFKLFLPKDDKPRRLLLHRIYLQGETGSD